MEKVVRNFWTGRRVLITGHTGFTGTWLAASLHQQGAHLLGIAIGIPTQPSIYEAIKAEEFFEASFFSDLTDDSRSWYAAAHAFDPEVVIHLAAQSLVPDAFVNPVNTFRTNVMGTVNLMEFARHAELRKQSLKVVLNVTTDKVYEAREDRAYVESDRLGAIEPYGASKVASEVVSSAYRATYLKEIKIICARAGNLVGGGDWSVGRLVPDIMRALVSDGIIRLRCAESVRPWQHVVDAVAGYLSYIEEAWTNSDVPKELNFGPVLRENISVKDFAFIFSKAWGRDLLVLEERAALIETKVLRLDSTQSHQLLRWTPQRSSEDIVHAVVDWYRLFYEGAAPGRLRALMFKQIVQK